MVDKQLIFVHRISVWQTWMFFVNTYCVYIYTHDAYIMYVHIIKMSPLPSVRRLKGS